MTAILNPVLSTGPVSQEDPRSLGKNLPSSDTNSFADLCIKSLSNAPTQNAPNLHATAISSALPCSVTSDALAKAPIPKPDPSSKLRDSLPSIQIVWSLAMNTTPISPAPNTPPPSASLSPSTSDIPISGGSDSTSNEPIPIAAFVPTLSTTQIPLQTESVGASPLQSADIGNVNGPRLRQTQETSTASASKSDSPPDLDEEATTSLTEDPPQDTTTTSPGSDFDLFFAAPTKFPQPPSTTVPQDEPPVAGVEPPTVQNGSASNDPGQVEHGPLLHLTKALSGAEISGPQSPSDSASVVSRSLKDAAAAAISDRSSIRAASAEGAPEATPGRSVALPIVVKNLNAENSTLTIPPPAAAATSKPDSSRFPSSDFFPQHVAVALSSEKGAALNGAHPISLAPTADPLPPTSDARPVSNSESGGAACTNPENLTSPASTSSATTAIQDVQPDNSGPNSQNPSPRKNASSLPSTGGVSTGPPATSIAGTSPISQAASPQLARTPISDPAPNGRASDGATDNLARLPVSPAPIKTGSVQMAQILSKEPQSEMRIDLNTSAFGKVEVRTLVQDNNVGLQIGSEKGDLRSLLATELPAITGNLQRHDLRLNEVNFHPSGLSFSSDSSRRDNPQPHSFAHKSASLAATPSEASLNIATPAESQDFAGTSFSVLA